MTVRIRFHAEAGDAANPVVHEEIFEYDEMPTKTALEATAKEFMWESIQPEFWWEEA